MGIGGVEGLSLRVKVAVALALAIVLSGIAAVVVVIGGDPVEAAKPGAVEPGHDTVIRSEDGDVMVTIPGGSVTESGTLTIKPVRRHSHDGWAVVLEGAEFVGDATIAFRGLDLEPGEPTPLVRWSRGPGSRLRVADQVSVEDGDVVVTTRHFSTWYVETWGDLRDAATRWSGNELRDRFEDLDGPEQPTPRCSAQDEAREAGYEVTGDSDQWVAWCLGLEGDAPVLRVVNGRGYAVAAEYTAGLDVVRSDRGPLADILAGLVTPPPTRKRDGVTLAPAGTQVDFGVERDEPRMGVMVRPDPGAYLVSTLDVAVETASTVMRRVGVRGATRRLLAALDGQQCLTSFTDLAATELDTPQQVQRFLSRALRSSYACVAEAADEVQLGALEETVATPVSWLLSEIGAGAEAVVAHADVAPDAEGHRITIEHEIAPPITEKSVESLLIPAGTCGTGSIGWDQREPIQLHHGLGQSFDRDGHGAGVLQTALVGAADVTGDGVDEAVVSLKCTGSPSKLCCAGRTSSLDFIAVLDLTGDRPRRVGDTITPTEPTDRSGTDEVRAFDGDAATLDGATVVTQQTLVYPEQVKPRDRAALEGVVRYRLRGDRWVASER